jgi:hypothetical protein
MPILRPISLFERFWRKITFNNSPMCDAYDPSDSMYDGVDKNSGLPKLKKDAIKIVDSFSKTSKTK